MCFMKYKIQIRCIQLLNKVDAAYRQQAEITAPPVPQEGVTHNHRQAENRNFYKGIRAKFPCVFLIQHTLFRYWFGQTWRHQVKNRTRQRRESVPDPRRSVHGRLAGIPHDASLSNFIRVFNEVKPRFNIAPKFHEIRSFNHNNTKMIQNCILNPFPASQKLLLERKLILDLRNRLIYYFYLVVRCLKSGYQWLQDSLTVAPFRVPPWESNTVVTTKVGLGRLRRPRTLRGSKTFLKKSAESKAAYSWPVALLTKTYCLCPSGLTNVLNTWSFLNPSKLPVLLTLSGTRHYTLSPAARRPKRFRRSAPRMWSEEKRWVWFKMRKRCKGVM